MYLLDVLVAALRLAKLIQRDEFGLLCARRSEHLHIFCFVVVIIIVVLDKRSQPLVELPACAVLILHVQHCLAGLDFCLAVDRLAGGWSCTTNRLPDG